MKDSFIIQSLLKLEPPHQKKLKPLSTWLHLLYGKEEAHNSKRFFTVIILSSFSYFCYFWHNFLEHSYFLNYLHLSSVTSMFIPDFPIEMYVFHDVTLSHFLSLYCIYAGIPYIWMGLKVSELHTYNKSIDHIAVV